MKKIKFFAVALFCALTFIACDIVVRPKNPGGNEDVIVPNERTIIFDTQGGTTALSITEEYGTEIVLPLTSQDGYVFQGWFDASSNGTRIGDIGDNYIIKADITLYAQWASFAELIIGTWHWGGASQDFMYVFHPDSTGSFAGANIAPFAYEVIDNEVRILHYATRRYQWSLIYKGNTLEDLLPSGITIVLERVKDENSIVGIWRSPATDDYYAFYPNNRGMLTSNRDVYVFTYTFSNSVVVVRIPGAEPINFIYTTGSNIFSNHKGVFFERQ